jgi:phosphoglycerol transferase MdoB-like AlkP superfamily enzyme
MRPGPTSTDPRAQTQSSWSPLRVALLYAAACFAVLQVARAANFWVLRESFDATAWTVIADSWLRGLRFDAAVTALFIGLPVIMLALPRPASWQRVWQWAWHGAACFGVLVMVLASITDHYFLAEVQRHIGQELLTVGNDMDYLAAYAGGPAVWGLLLLAASVALVTWGCMKLVRRGHPRASAWQAVVLLLSAWLMIRGAIIAKPINPIDAFKAETYELAQLQLNGAFTMAKALGRGAPSISQREYEAALAQLGQAPGDHPFARRVQGGTPHNVVIFLLESWSAGYVDAFRDGPPLGLTPNMDRMAREGVVFPNFYASGQRSFEGVQAVLTGLPALPGVPTLTEGLTLRMPRVGAIAAGAGARTIFTQSARRISLRLDSVAHALGFREYYGREDNARLLLDYPDAEAFRYGLDHETMQGLAARLHDERRPFLAFLFSGSTHAPYAPVPPALQSHYPAGHPDKGLYDVIHYADWSIGQFMERARQEPWFDDTVFIFTADHTHRARGPYEELCDRFDIPLVIYAPGLLEPRVDTRVASHVDIFDTTMDLLGVQADYASTGHSLLGPSKTDRVLVRSGENLGLAKAGRCLMFKPGEAGSDAEYLAAYRSVLYGVIQRDAWLP